MKDNIPINKPVEKVQFIEFDEPNLDAGAYTLKATQKILGESFTFTQTYAVFGERFSINPANIHALSPPAGSTGVFNEIIPSISLKKSTLPWERTPFSDHNGYGYPWMTLLLVEEKEMTSKAVKKPKIISLKDLQEDQTVKFPSFTLEMSQKLEDKLTVLDVKKDWLERMLPDSEELKLLAHIRKRDTSKKAMVMCHRMPTAGSRINMHLVSLEKRYKKNTGFDYQSASANDYIRLVSLKSWDFTSLNKYKVTQGTLKKLGIHNIPIKPTVKTVLEAFIKEAVVYDGKEVLETALKTVLAPFFVTDTKDALQKFVQEVVKYALYTRTFEQIVEDIDTGNLHYPIKKETSPKLKVYLEKGYIPLPHTLRESSTTNSWYHGPLTPFYKPSLLATNYYKTLPDFGDALTEYFADKGMFDLSYSSAYQLGRLEGLKDKLFTKKIYEWKYKYNQSIANQEQSSQVTTIGVVPKKPSVNIEDRFLKSWFDKKSLLDEIPMNYILPDKGYLPEESIRFFAIDENWIECMLYGAFSIGGYLRKSDYRKSGETEDEFNQRVKNTTLKQFHKLSTKKGKRSGVLIRSQLVSGWPDLLIEGFEQIPVKHDDILKNPLTLLRKDYLSPDVMLCIFEGTLQTADVFIQPQGLHFGADLKKNGGYEKELYFSTAVIQIPFKDTSNTIIHMSGLKNTLARLYNKAVEEITSADLGMELIDGANKGRFVITNPL